MFAKFHSLFKQSALYGLGHLLSKGVAFFLIPVYTRVLTTEDYGILGVVTSVIAVLNIFLAVGIGNSILRFYHEYTVEEERRKYLGTATIILLVFSLSGALLVDLVVAPYVADRYMPSIPYTPYLRLGIWIAFVTNFAIVPLALARIQERPLVFIGFTVGGFLSNTLTIIYFVVVLRQGAAGSLRGWLISSCFMAVPYAVYILRNARLSFSLQTARIILGFSLPLVPGALGIWALNVSDRLILQQYVPLGALGLYNLGYKIALILNLVSVAIHTAWIPVYYREARTAEGQKLIIRFTTYIAMLMAFLGLGLSLLSREVIAVMSHPDFHAAYLVVPPVALGYWFVAVNGTLSQSLMLARKTYYLPVATLLAGAANVVLNLWLVPRYGIMAAAYNTAIGYALFLGIIVLISNRVYRIRYEYRRIGLTLFVAAGVYLLGAQVSSDSLALSVLLKSLLLIGFPFLLWFFRLFHPEELLALVRLWRGFSRSFRLGTGG